MVKSSIPNSLCVTSPDDDINAPENLSALNLAI